MRNIIVTGFLLALLCGCGKDDEMQTSLIITTLDGNGDPLPGTNVDLYPSVEDWLSETSAIYDTEISDIDGNVKYMTLDTGTYYINAYLDGSTNWEEGVVKNVIDGFQNTTNITVVENPSAILSNASGKKWVLDEYFRNGEDAWEFLDDCIKDDTLIFYKGPAFGDHHVSSGSLKCSESQGDLLTGKWTLLNEGSLLKIEIGNDLLNWNIDTLKVEKLSVSYVDAGNVQNAHYISLE